MRLSQTELKIIEQIANGITDIKSISNNIKKSNKQIYKSSEKLKDHNFLRLSNGVLIPRKTTHVTLLLQLLREFPNLTIILSGSGLQIISSLTKPKKIADIKRETGISKTVIYDKLQQFLDISAIVRLENNKFLVNKSIWNNLYHFLEEFKKYEETTDPRVPANSTIYYKNDNEIVFSNNASLPAIPTGFSAYQEYGIKLLLPTNYYYLPNKSLTKQEIFLHSLYITEKEQTIRHKTYTALFYVKYQKELFDLIHPLIHKIKQVIQGKQVRDFPSLEEIKEKAELYDIRF